jgi:hypothetical protein
MVNDPATLWTGQRTKQAQRLGVGIVQVRALLRISARGIVRVSEYRSGTNLDPGAEMIAAALIGNNADALAHADGFENWAAAWAWHDAHREKKESGSTAILRELIAWRLLPPEVEAAFDRGDWMMEAA